MGVFGAIDEGQRGDDVLPPRMVGTFHCKTNRAQMIEMSQPAYLAAALQSIKKRQGLDMQYRFNGPHEWNLIGKDSLSHGSPRWKRAPGDRGLFTMPLVGDALDPESPGTQAPSTIKSVNAQLQPLVEPQFRHL